MKKQFNRTLVGKMSYSHILCAKLRKFSFADIDAANENLAYYGESINSLRQKGFPLWSIQKDGYREPFFVDTSTKENYRGVAVIDCYENLARPEMAGTRRMKALKWWWKTPVSKKIDRAVDSVKNHISHCAYNLRGYNSSEEA